MPPRSRSMVKQLGGTFGALLLLLVAAPGAALGAGEGLPRTYKIQAIDSPSPALGGVLGRGMASAGDLNADGEDDLLLPQQANSPNNDGQVFVMSGATGALIATIVAPDPGGAGTPAGFGSFWTARLGMNRGSAPFSDIASCPAGSTGQLCARNPIGAPDGVPDIIVGARGVDARGLIDAGRVYIFDGATRALLKRIDQPAADTTPLALSRAGGTGFGRTALNPAGMPACQGNFGLGACPPATGTGAVPEAVRIGDMDGGGRPDLVIGASQTTEDSNSAHPGSHCARTLPVVSRCEQAGIVYIYRGEEIVGSNPASILDGTGPGESFRRLKNLDAQADDTSSVNADTEQLGNALTAVGDVGKCTAAIAPGERCPRAGSTSTPDGLPEVLVPAPGADLPLEAPDRGFANAGAAYLIDGATGSVLYTYLHPERQTGATFASQLGSHEPAVGDLGGTGLPDIYTPAPGQNTTITGAGRGYVVNGNFRTGSASVLLSRLEDPTPQKGGTFGGGSAGVGDLVGGAENPRNELLIGVEGFTGALGDVHFFNASNERVLQTIPDPANQVGAAFGGAIVPLGDLNEDGLLDFAVGSEGYSGTTGIAEGRFYIYRSDNSPAPPTPRPPGSGSYGTAPPGASAATLAGRDLELLAGSSRLRRGRVLRLRGAIDAFSNEAVCERRQSVSIQRRRPGSLRYRTLRRVRTGGDGTFALKTRPRRTYVYRARLSPTSQCLGAVSNRERVSVVRARRAR